MQTSQRTRKKDLFPAIVTEESYQSNESLEECEEEDEEEFESEECDEPRPLQISTSLHNSAHDISKKRRGPTSAPPQESAVRRKTNSSPRKH